GDIPVWVLPKNSLAAPPAAARNVITVGGSFGVGLSGSSSNTIQGNYFGTNAAGTAAPGPVGAGHGILIAGGANNQIGGTAAGAGNVISNYSTGIRMTDDGVGHGATGNIVQGN